MQYWTDNAIFDVNCPECGGVVEFYKDDTTRKCPSCSHRFVNPKMDFGCASYCQFAEQCLGTLPEDFVGTREDLIKDKVAVEVKRYYHSDFKMIKKAANVARYAENIGKEEGGNLGVLLCASYLHGLPEDTVSTILQKAGASEPLEIEIRKLLDASSDKKGQALGTGILSDALTLSTLLEDVKNGGSELSDTEKEELLTSTQKRLNTGSARTLIETIVA